ncbi:hypothetical protein K2173_008571 [Erythroxylum novogranatense]|uniref:DNA mismatch repair protein n=1 Tax=Erythroxylum novogranatense TaxID=1862640 RepID=A0AAV8SLE8_9ROSI|nr:hypothetical protein K2173_008571 [Erythroxylum novogranatense]
MGREKQQVISRFFAPKPKTSDSPPPATNPLSSSSSSNPPLKISATVSFSPAKRKLLSSHLASTSKRPKLSPHTQNPIPNPSLPIPNPSLHQKFIDKLLEPIPEDPHPQISCHSGSVKFTPLEQQVVDLKGKYPDVLLMIEVGYKYRFFGEDAEIAARVLGIYAHKDRNFMTASVPTFRLSVHVRRLVSAGYKVGVVKQTETAAIKAHGDTKIGPFSRGLSALYTKATLEAAEDLGGGEEGCGGESNYLCCVVEKSVLEGNDDCEGVPEVRIGFVAVEISTGDVVYGELNDGFMRSRLEAVVLSLSPAELLLGDPLSKLTEKSLLAYAGPASNVRVEHASRDCFSNGNALADIMSLYENIQENIPDNRKQTQEVTEQRSDNLLIKEIINMPDLAVQALALTIHHLKQFGFDSIWGLGASFRSFSSNMEMNLSANTLQQLEVLRNNSNGSEFGSLLHMMNHTLTKPGSRLMRHWVTHPLCARSMINARLDAVSEIAESMGSYRAAPWVNEIDKEKADLCIVQPDFYNLLSSVLTTLGRSSDIQRGITRIFHRTAAASEFIAVIQAILYAGKPLQRLNIEEDHDNARVHAQIVKSVLLKKLLLTASSTNIVGIAAKLLSMLNKEAAEQKDLANLILSSKDQFPEVAKAREAVQLAKDKLDSLISIYRKHLRMRNLEFFSVSGITHLIELPSDVKVPLSWVKVNSTKKTIRYHPPEVIAALDELSLANEELMVVCRAAWDRFLMGFGKYYAEFQAAVQALATLDCLHALATLSKNKNYIRPVFVDNEEPVQIHICSGRHPVLETILQDNFVPNDTNLHSNGEYCQIITGPNMGGKSCYIRQVALIALMAQVGSFVPALSVKLHVLDQIYTRMGASDSIQQGRSTFLEELSEACYILNNCTPNSLVIIDELGRGTSTHDGGAIAYAALHHLLEEKKSMVLFVTHYPKIADIKREFPGSVGAYHVSYLTSQKNTEATDLEFDGENVTYLYKLVPGVSEKSFGLKVAQLAQIPSSCIRRAIAMSSELEAVVNSRIGNKSGSNELIKGLPMDEEQPEQSTEICSNPYRELFWNLKLALQDDDPTKCIQFLANVKRIAEDLTSTRQIH